MVHSEIMLLEIIKLYVHSTKESSLELETLESAFYTLEEIAGSNLGISIEYEFYHELEKLEDISEGLIVVDDEFIQITDDEYLDQLEDQVLLALDGEDLNLDGFISEYVYNICLYKDLKINPPLEEYQEILNTCLTISRDYQLLAYHEVQNGKKISSLTLFLKCLVAKYNELYSNLTFEDTFKIKVILAYLNDLYLLDSDSDFVNSAWYIILFSKNEMQQHFLSYERLSHSINEEDEEYEQDEEEESEFSFDDLPTEVTYLFDEISFFLRYYTVLFNEYLKQIEDGEVKTNLNIKKYLLIAIQPEMEEYYLENGTIDTLKLPELKQEWINDQSFTSLYLIATESVDSFNYMDATITNEIYADMIIRGLFIRSFLDLCGNNENLEDIKARICNSNFYKNPNYSVATNIVDDIIFRTKGMELSLHNKY